jgi:DNA-binding beta-propeller fold protein YncE
MRKPLLLATVLLALGGCRPPESLAPDPTPTGFGAPADPVTGQYIDPHARSVVHASHPLPAISGGTLAATVDGALIVAADPDRDRVLIVDSTSGEYQTVRVPAGSEPGRVAIDDANHLAHVVLRGSGEVASIALEGNPTITRHAVCSAPRGVAVDSDRSLVRVACRDGELATFNPMSGLAPSVVDTGIDDLRDVIVHGDELVLTRFRSAELVRFNPSTGTSRPTHVTPISSTSPTAVRADGTPAEFQPGVAWRAIPVGGDIYLAHQRSSDGELLTAPGAYYDTGVCSGSIVQSAATIFQGDALTPVATPNIAGATLPVDIAVSPLTGEVAIVGAGIQNTDSFPSVTILAEAELAGGAYGGYYGGYGGCIDHTYENLYDTSAHTGARYTPNAIAAIYLPDGRLVVQGREPAQIRIEDHLVSLGGESVFDTGHAFYHGDAGRGTACASCHPEGGDDGRVWTFAGIGPRRTPTVPAGFLNTAPFHWSGDLPDLSHLMGTVFTERMGGPAVDRAHSTAVGEWLDTRPMDPQRARASDAVARGAATFADAGCAGCHSGAMYTNNETVDVGTGGSFQVPSLVGVSRALPVMHDGCAHTLAQRFDPACGGHAHGGIASADDPRVPDLIAYLETL